MLAPMLNDKIPIHFTVPEQNISRLTFTHTKPAAVESWVESLPITNINKSARLLYPAVQEITALKSTPEIKFAMLEALRMQIQLITESLAQLFLNKPIALPPALVKVATLAQALRKHHTNGYKVIIQQLMNAPINNTSNSLMSLAIYHAIKGYTLFLLRGYQLYLPIPTGIWHEMHSLYHLAEQRGLVSTSLEDTGNKYQVQSNIVIAYLRAVMLGCAKPNKMRQKDLEKTFHTLELWLQHIDFHHDLVDNQSSLFVIPMNEDSPPLYRDLVKGTIDSSYRHIDTTYLVKELASYTLGESTTLDIPNDISRELIEHLITTWGAQQNRASIRYGVENETIDACIGLQSTHYYLSGMIAFKNTIGTHAIKASSAVNNPFLSGTSTTQDILVENEDMPDEQEKQTSNDTPANNKDAIHPVFNFKIINSSSGGFCFELSNDIPEHVRIGEVIGIRKQSSNDDNHSWSIGVIRWLRQIKSGSQMGIELLGQSATPCGAAVVRNPESQSEYLRALLLPELPALNQPLTLITTQLMFEQGGHVILDRCGRTTTGRLTKRLLSTGIINQFEFFPLDNNHNHDDISQSSDN